ncbi:MAG: DUF4251 domain-containing protein [Chlorobi bacterium]|nr:DUF4251 domain-containing protein [Chlorobiota bacterium]
MKTYFRIFTLIILVTGFGFTLNAQKSSKKEDKKKARNEKKAENFKKTKELFESRDFVFNADRAFPTGMRSIDLTTNSGYIKLKNDSVEADLPFFGRSYSADYSGNAGINFKGKAENAKTEYNDKKHKILYSFTVNDKDTYQVSMTITEEGGASVTINSNSKNSISYNGKIEKPKAEKKKKG